VTSKPELEARIVELEKALAEMRIELATIQTRTVANLTGTVLAIGGLREALSLLNALTMTAATDAATAKGHELVADSIGDTFDAVRTVIEAWQAEAHRHPQPQGAPRDG
jgi:hypothetical protein